MATRINWADVINESKATEDQRVSNQDNNNDDYDNVDENCDVVSYNYFIDANILIINITASLNRYHHLKAS